jgi:transposase
LRASPRKKGKHASQKQRRANAVFSQWSFAQLQGLIASKALRQGSLAITVDAGSTSQACPMCGQSAWENRPGKGLRFVCQRYQYSLHADLVRARNLVLRTLLVRQDWARTGQVSLVPDVSDKEAKAERLHQFSEVRWSSDTSLPLYDTFVISGEEHYFRAKPP